MPPTGFEPATPCLRVLDYIWYSDYVKINNHFRLSDNSYVKLKIVNTEV